MNRRKPFGVGLALAPRRILQSESGTPRAADLHAIASLWLRFSPLRTLIFAIAASALLPARLDAVTLMELITQPNLTPKKFASYFEDFEYEFGHTVLPAETFLQARRGDCDDYAILADYVMRRHNQPTRLIHVRMVGQVAHAVCYVTDSKAYLDFNNRKFFINVQRSGKTLREIATKVADSLKANWTSASEFTYTYDEDKKHFGVTVVKTDPPAKDPDTHPPAAKGIKP